MKPNRTSSNVERRAVKILQLGQEAPVGMVLGKSLSVGGVRCDELFEIAVGDCGLTRFYQFTTERGATSEV